MTMLSVALFSSAGSEKSSFAMKLLDAALEKGNEVKLWLAGNATTLAAKEQKEYKNYFNFERDLNGLIEKGLDVAVCEMCARTRGIKEADLIDGVEFRLMDWFLESAAAGDRTLNIGGE